MTAPSSDDLYGQERAIALIKRPDLKLAPGDGADLQLRASQAMADLVVGFHAGRIKALYLDGASGDDLTALARDRGVERDLATPSIGSVTLTHTPGPVGTVASGTRVATAVASDGTFVTIVTTQDAVFGALDGSKTVTAQAATAGVAGNVDPSTIVRILDPLFDTFTVTNAQRFAGGSEDETDPELRARVRGYAGTLRRATVDAIIFGAETVPQVRIANFVASGIPGIGTLYIADQLGNSNAAMIAAVQAVMPAWIGATMSLTVTGGVVVQETIAFVLSVKTGVDAAALVDKARAAVVSYVNQLDIGDGAGIGTLYRQGIAEAARSVDQLNIVTVTVSTPAADIVPSQGQVLRTTLDLVSGS